MTLYEELGKLAANKNVIPSDCMTFSEAASYVVEYTDSEYNKLFEAVGIEELAIYESTGVQVVYEGGKLSELKDKVVNFLKRIWQAIKDLFTKIVGWFMTRSKEAKAKLTNISVEDAKKYLDDKKKYGICSNWDKFDDNFRDLLGQDRFRAKTNSAVNKLTALANTSVDDEGKFKDNTNQSDFADAAKKIVEDFKKEAFKEFTGEKEVDNLAQFRSALIKELNVEETHEVEKDEIVKNLDDYKKYVLEGKASEDIKKLYDACKKTMEDNIKEAEKSLGEKKSALVVSYLADCLKTASAAASMVCSVASDKFKKRYTQYLIILVRTASAVKAGKKKAEKEDKKKVEESTNVANTSVDASFIDEAFNW